MLIFSVSFQFFRMHPRREQLTIDLNRVPTQNFEFCLDDGCGREYRPGRYRPLKLLGTARWEYVLSLIVRTAKYLVQHSF
jgi:hypothetical protein